MVLDLSVGGDSTTNVEGIKSGLEAALHEKDVELPTEPRPGFKDENVKIQKEVYRVSKDWEIPIVRTWYRYGQFEPYATLRPKNISPQPLTQPEKRVYGDITREEIKSYFLSNGIKSDWETPLFEFLEENYTDWAPPEYRNAYLANLDILKTLDGIYSASHEELRDSAGSFVDELKSPVIDLRYELEYTSEFDENVQNHVIGFLENLRDGLISLEASSEDGLPIQTIKRSYNVYHGYIWPWAAMNISIDKAEAPRHELRSFRNKGREMLTQFRETFPERRNDWENEARSVGLEPTMDEYYQVQGNVNKSVGDLEKGSMLSALDD